MSKKLIVQIHKAGSLYTARWAGDANKVFGVTPEDAEQRLILGLKMYGKMPSVHAVQGAALKGR